MSGTITAKEYQRLVLKSAPKLSASRPIPRVIPLNGKAVSAGVLSLAVVPPSLNNVFINIKGGRTRSPLYRKWCGRAAKDLQRQSGWHVADKISIRLIFRRGETRADLDNLIKPCLDLLVSNGRISDDRNVRKIEAEFADDLTGVRIEIRSLP